MLNVVSLIERNLNLKASIEFLPMQPGDVKQTYADIDKPYKLLKYKPKVDVADGIKNFIDWYKKYNKV